MFGRSARRSATILLTALGVAAMPVVTTAALPVAHADSGETCQYNASTTSITPIAVQGSNDGNFAFAGTGTCVGTLGVGAVFVDVSAAYYDAQCGSGTAIGTMTISGAVNKTLSFSADFVAFQGEQTLYAGGIGGGTFSITPNVGGCVTGPVTSATLSATVAGDFF